MLNILLISDTHGFFDQRLEKHVQQCDEVWHAGDIGPLDGFTDLVGQKTLRAVYGNIDDNAVRAHFPENNIFLVEEMKVLITHIGGYPGKYTVRAKKLIAREKPGIFITGHSHILKVIYDKENELLHINPGAAGNQGFHRVKTAVKFSLSGNSINNLSIIELGPRAT